METIVFGRVPPDGVASNSLTATERELVTTTTTDGVTFFCDFFWGFFCGFAVEPAKGSWRLMQEHVWNVLAGGDRASAEYIFRFAAWAVQHPDERVRRYAE